MAVRSCSDGPQHGIAVRIRFRRQIATLVIASTISNSSKVVTKTMGLLASTLGDWKPTS